MTELYRGMDRAALDAAYNNGAAVRNSAEIVADWQARSERLRNGSAATLDLRYGAAERNRIDLFQAAGAGRRSPLLVFIHGGYWQMRSKEVFAFIAEGPLAHGISVALVGYTLAPQARLDGIVAEMRASLDFLAKDHPALILSGWSAGGHLTAMILSHPAVKAGLAISGLYDLEAMRLCYVNDKLRLDADEARRNSPMFLLHEEKPLVIAYGTNELPELQRQSEDFGRKLKKARVLPLAGQDHFTILEQLASPQGALTAALRNLI